MSQRNEYKDPVIEALIAKLNVDGPARLKNKYYHGDVLLVPQSDLPIATISYDQERIYAASTGEDEHYLPIAINVLYDYSRDLNQSNKLAVGATGLYDLVCGRDPETLQYKQGTIMYALWKNQQVQPKFWISVGRNEQITANFGMGIERRGKGIYSTEAMIRFAVKLHLPQVT